MSESFSCFFWQFMLTGAATFNIGSPLPFSDAHTMFRIQPQTDELEWCPWKSCYAQHGAGTQVELGVPPPSSPVSHCSELGHASGVTSTGPWVVFHLKKMWNECRGSTCLADPPLNPVSPVMYLGEIPWSLLYENGTFFWFPAIMCLFIIIFFWQFQ